MRKLTITLIAILIVFLAPYLILFGLSIFHNSTLKHLIALLYLWQTQTSAFFAITTTFIGATLIWYQTQESRHQEEQRRAAKARALQAVLVLTISELYDYALTCSEILAGLIAKTTLASIPISVELFVRFPDIPEGLTDRIKDSIEYSIDSHVRPFTLLIQCLQTHHSRIRELQKRLEQRSHLPIFRSQLISCAIDSAELYARCDKMIIYAREQANVTVGLISKDNVKASLPLIRSVFSNVGEIHTAIDYKAAHNGEWPEN